jgi:hypothetical protein
LASAAAGATNEEKTDKHPYLDCGTPAVRIASQRHQLRILDVVPEQMPFNTPYGAPISLEKALAAIQAAVAEANKRGYSLHVSDS